MHILKSTYLSDGKRFNDGRSVHLIRIDGDLDFEALLDNIIQSNYYDLSYFDNHIDYQEGRLKFDAFYLASIMKSFKPESILELGCGRGDVLFLMGLDPKVRIQGIEFSRDVLEATWPPLQEKVDCGDIMEVCKKYSSRKILFDSFCAFDLWEHLLPAKLHDYIDSLVTLAKKDALFFFIIPAFGEDKVFGEIFPLELEENREKFNQRLPFEYLNAESIDPAIPANGHLIWAHSEWWQKQFERHGLVRAELLEGNIHQYFDEHLFYARRSFYVFHLDSRQARRRVNRIMRNGLTFFKKWKIIVRQQESLRRLEIEQENSFIDHQELKSTLNHVEFYMNLTIKEKINRWAGKPFGGKNMGRLVGPALSRAEKSAIKYLDRYVERIKKQHYLV